MIFLAAALLTQGCVTKPEYVQVYPDCPVIAPMTLSEVDSGVLYSVLTLPHSLYPKDVSELLPDVPMTYNGKALYWDLKNNQTEMVTMILSQEAAIQRMCNGKNK